MGSDDIKGAAADAAGTTGDGIDRAGGRAADAASQAASHGAAQARDAVDHAAGAAQGIASQAQDAAASLGSKVQDAASSAQEVASDAIGKAQSFAQEQVRSLSDSLPGSASEAYDVGQRAVSQGGDRLGRQVVDRPIEALLLAGAIGYLVGWATSRS